MSFVPEEEVRGKTAQNLAPMLDFLFLMLMFFASLAISRVTLQETEVQVVEASNGANNQQVDHDLATVNIVIDRKGAYKLSTQMRDYPLATPAAIAEELTAQQRNGLLPPEKASTHILLKIDREAQWEPILQAIFAIRDAGFEVYPLYLPEDGEKKAAVADG